MLPAFSVTIPAYNEGERIGETLRATFAYLRKETPATQLIVVNDGSTDKTGAVAREVLADVRLHVSAQLRYQTLCGFR